MNAEEFVVPTLKATRTLQSDARGRYLAADCVWRRCEVPNFRRIFPRIKKETGTAKTSTSHYDNSAFAALLGKHSEIRSHTASPFFSCVRSRCERGAGLSGRPGMCSRWQPFRVSGRARTSVLTV